MLHSAKYIHTSTLIKWTSEVLLLYSDILLHYILEANTVNLQQCIYLKCWILDLIVDLDDELSSIQYILCMRVNILYVNLVLLVLLILLFFFPTWRLCLETQEVGFWPKCRPHSSEEWHSSKTIIGIRRNSQIKWQAGIKSGKHRQNLKWRKVRSLEIKLNKKQQGMET